MSLQDYRMEIDEIDAGLVELLEKRMRVIEDVARLKYDEEIEIEDSRREQEVLDSVAEMASPDLADYLVSIFSSIIAESKEFQSYLLNEFND